MNYLRKNIDIASHILILICLISFWGGIIYRIYSLNNIGVIISLILAIISFIIIQRFKTTVNRRQKIEYRKINQDVNAKLKAKKNNLINITLFTVYCLLFTAALYTLFLSQTVKAIISPWQVVPNYFFAIYAIATLILITVIIRGNETMKQWNNIKLFLISLHYFLSFSVALIIYKIGYGFDPFIHQATVDLINKTGSVDPKPLYYLGQYGFIVILHKITTISLIWLDKLLVPLLAAIYLPITLWRVFKKWFSNNTSSLFLILTLLIVPFSFLIVTTPQNFTYLLLLLVILLGLICNNLFDLIIIYLLALTTIIIQPIAGIPALLFALLLTTYHGDIKTRQGKSLKKYLYSLIFIASTISLPSAFYLFEKSNNTPPFSKEGLGGFWDGILPNLIVPGQENFILNFIYLYGFNLKIIISSLVIAGLIIAYRHRKTCKIFFLYFLMSASLGISYLLTAKLPFLFLIDYERNSYTDRILLIAAFFLLPFIIVALYGFIDKLLRQSKAIKIPFLIFIIIIITTSIYLSYPRFDRYFNSRGYSTGQNDIKAVHWIENNTQEDYIVLANQQVSAAALKEFGFVKYYNNNKLFYYPIPTGGPLYQYYLDMVYEKPSRETMLAAMDLAGVNKGYFVLNKYWWAFPKLLEEAKLGADNWEEIDNGDVYVFKYISNIQEF